jgi:hypothetical protein
MVRYRELFEEIDLERIERLLKKHFKFNPGDCKIQEDGKVHALGIVTLKELKKKAGQLPIQFSRAEGDFLCHSNELRTLLGSPNYVGMDFGCSRNNLPSLKGGPEIVNNSYWCYHNPLTSLEGFPKELNGIFGCTWSPNLPLLRTLITKQRVQMWLDTPGGNTLHPAAVIINQFLRQGASRRVILDCQKALIEAGFAGNAEW